MTASALGGLRAAVSFLTRVPVGRPPAEDELRLAPAFFPAVGAAIGGAMAGAFAIAAPAGALPAACVALAAGMWLTGAFHEDGLADTADALGGALDRDRLFDILKDSRIGAYGAAALAASLVLRAALIAALADRATAALVATQALARLPPVWLMATLPYVTAHDRRRSPAFRAGAREVGVASAFAAIAVTAAGLSVFEMIASAAAAAVVTLACGWRFRARAGGLTGDFLGATEQVAECALLLALALAT
ncbi:MAG: adenosylcobinamide-GDP ribazoletransferase [Deltaproteobacteria bacterium]|nr:MAG: adenosylcobinamide-GDP ribazoletransferase [Deltaproteobacteria bacterium]